VQDTTHVARTPPVADLKQPSVRSNVFKALKKSLSTTSLSSASRKPPHVPPSNLYGDTYCLDVAPSYILERMIRDDLRNTGLGDLTPYNNGAFYDLRSSRSALHSSSSCRFNASTIPTLIVSTHPKITPPPSLHSPFPPRLPTSTYTPQRVEGVMNVVPGRTAASPSSIPCRPPRLKPPRSLRTHNDHPADLLSVSSTQKSIDQLHDAHVDKVLSSSTRKTIESHHPPSPHLAKKRWKFVKNILSRCFSRATRQCR